MDIVSILVVLCVLCGIWNVVVSLMIYDSLKKRGIPVSFLWLRMMVPKYAFQYKEITKAENGSVGPLFYHWIVSINLALAFVIIAVIAGL